jgi:hypothetical protein
MNGNELYTLLKEKSKKVIGARKEKMTFEDIKIEGTGKYEEIKGLEFTLKNKGSYAIDLFITSNFKLSLFITDMKDLIFETDIETEREEGLLSHYINFDENKNIKAHAKVKEGETCLLSDVKLTLFYVLA